MICIKLCTYKLFCVQNFSGVRKRDGDTSAFSESNLLLDVRLFEHAQVDVAFLVTERD